MLRSRGEWVLILNRSACMTMNRSRGSKLWFGQENRLALLRQALDVARRDPPKVIRGDLRTDVGTLTAQAPRGATLVVFHSAVLGYIPSEPDRAEFPKTLAQIGVD